MRLSLYIHFPFCLSKCLYCDFNSRATAHFPASEYADLVIREMKLAASALSLPIGSPTLYFGGGTPSLMEPAQVARIVDAADSLFSLETGAEVTLEANPGTLSRERAEGFRLAGVNRLSLGIQSFEDRLLTRLGRIHSVREAYAAVDAARAGGFRNLSIDLMHSLPEQSLKDWEEALAKAAALAPEHISAYALTVEEGTPFAALEHEGELRLPDEEEGALMFEATARVLAEAGFGQYEISNFARPDLQSRHNTVYWTRGSYLGFGAGAHSFLNADGLGERWHNDPSPERYRACLSEGKIPSRERLQLTARDALSESFFLGLRMLEGIDTDRLAAIYGTEAVAPFLAKAEALVLKGLLERERGNLRLAPEAVILGNAVFAEFV